MLSRRDFLKLGSATLLAAVLSKFEIANADDSTLAPLIYHGSTRHRYVALTYDDCYLLRKMQELENLLDEYPEFKITLFPVGVALLNLERQDAGIWKRFCDKGHEIGYHSWDHNNFGVMSPRAALDDYARWLEALTKVLGSEPKVRFGRPTFGSLSQSFDVVCSEYGLVNTMWSTGWGGVLEDGLRAAQKSKNGDIVLLHIRTQDTETSCEAYPWLRENNWGVVTLSKLYDDLLLEQYNSEGCDVGIDSSLTRTCME
jgi:peptidoglycan/xylan/chitin deacetylase (PgdA/CDA1 family)